MKKLSIFSFLLLLLTLSGCEFIGDVFGAGVYLGVFLSIFVVVVIIILLVRITKK
jgi:hypothetical protein